MKCCLELPSWAFDLSIELLALGVRFRLLIFRNMFFYVSDVLQGWNNPQSSVDWKVFPAVHLNPKGQDLAGICCQFPLSMPLVSLDGTTCLPC